jgi:hypothetical protein
MTPEELTALQESIAEKMKSAATKPELEALKSELKKAQDDMAKLDVTEVLKAQKDEFDAKLKAQWDEVEERLKKEEPLKPQTFADRVKAAFNEAGLLEKVTIDGVEIERVKWNRDPKASAEIRMKAAFDMNTAGTTANVNTGYQTDFGMVPLELPLSTDMHMYDVFGHTPLSPIDRYFGVVIESEETDGSGLKPETSAAGDSSYKLSTEDYKVFDFGVKFRAHDNMLQTWTGLMQRIQTIGLDRLKSKISTFVLGSGGDNSATPYGLADTGKFTAYDTALRAGTVAGANIVDAIKNALLQAELSEKMVNAVMLNPTDIAVIESLKDEDKNTVRQAGLIIDSTGRLSYIYGLRVIRTKKVTANTAWLVNTAESVQFGDKYSFRVRMGYDKDSDFSKNIVTIQPEVSLAIGLGDPKQIIYISSLTAAAAALNPVQA